MAVATQRFLNSRTRWIVFALIIVFAVYLLAFTPAKTYFEQRSEMASAQERYDALASANRDLQERASNLQTDEYLAQEARDKYELVPEGATAYAVMPPSTAASATEDVEAEQGFWSKVGDTITFWN